MELLQQTLSQIGDVDHYAAAKAKKRLDSLIKPQGSLGKLETIAIQLAGIQGKARPELGRKLLVIMAVEHGVAQEGVSAFPKDASQKLMLNFLQQGAAVNVLANYTQTSILLVDVGLREAPLAHPDLYIRRIRSGSGNIVREAAMTHSEAVTAIETGIELTNQKIDDGYSLLAIGESGIANTTLSTAILACLSHANIEDITGRGTGLNDAELYKKQQIIKKALAINKPDPSNPLDVLSKVGGLEIAALTGVILACAARRVPLVLDGFVSGSAALLACRMDARCRQYMIAAHLSEEPGHKQMLQDLELTPLLDFGLRIGEGTGAVLVLPLLEAAVKIMQEMATFEEAGINL